MFHLKCFIRIKYSFNYACVQVFFFFFYIYFLSRLFLSVSFVITSQFVEYKIE
jgi:hypothetical protein